jgi:hypothetical protein
MKPTKPTTKGKFCYNWGLVEAKSPVIFKDACICSEECAKYVDEFQCCIDILHQYYCIKNEQLFEKETNTNDKMS